MGPVAAIAYGSTIFDRKLVRLAWTTELVSLLFCIFVGVVIGAITGATPLAKDWLTDEMITRCTMSNFYVGIPVSFGPAFHFERNLDALICMFYDTFSGSIL